MITMVIITLIMMMMLIRVEGQTLMIMIFQQGKDNDDDIKENMMVMA